MITYNQPSEERKNVVALSVEEMNTLVSHFNIHYSDMPEMQKQVQRLIWHYENLEHFHTVVGGWEGYNAMRKDAAKYNLAMKTNESVLDALGYKIVPIEETNTSIHEFCVSYELVKPSKDETA